MPQQDEARLDWGGDSAESMEGRGVDTPVPRAREESSENGADVPSCLMFPQLDRVMRAVIVGTASPIHQAHLRKPRNV
jgi:hypothetical protein